MGHLPHKAFNSRQEPFLTSTALMLEAKWGDGDIGHQLKDLALPCPFNSFKMKI